MQSMSEEYLPYIFLPDVLQRRRCFDAPRSVVQQLLRVARIYEIHREVIYIRQVRRCQQTGGIPYQVGGRRPFQHVANYTFSFLFLQLLQTKPYKKITISLSGGGPV